MLPDEDCGIVLRFQESGERFLSLAFFSETQGLYHPLLRPSKKDTRPDLFDTARIKLSKAKQGSLVFASEYSPIRRRSGLSRSYANLTLAARFAEIIRINIQHLPDHQIIFELSSRLFDSLESAPAPKAAYLKTLYLFAKTEGFAVREDWVAGLDRVSRESLAQILRRSLAEQTDDPHLFDSLTLSLENWLSGNADFIIPRNLSA